jgi:hypothetical protein
MDLSGFKARLEALGADLTRWPPLEADAAVELLARDETAQDFFAKVTAETLQSSDRDEPLADKIWRRIKKPD